MKLIIDIPAETYAFVKQLQWVSMGRGNCKTIQQTVINSIKFGVKQPQGEWIYGEDDCGQDGWFCSECGFFVPWYYQYYEKDIDFIRNYKVCPHCISEMITYTGKDRDTRGNEE